MQHQRAVRLLDHPPLGLRDEPFAQVSGVAAVTPPTARSWSRRGSTPVIRVRGRSQRRFSIAALCCYKPGERSRLVYRPKRHKGAQGRGPQELRLDRVPRPPHRRPPAARRTHRFGLGQLNVHKDRRMRAFIDAQDWLTAYHLPSSVPDLNPVEGIWSIFRRPPQANTAFTDPSHLMRQLRHGLRQIQYRSDIIDGCLTGTGLTLTTSRPQPQQRVKAISPSSRDRSRCRW
ncbi:transposase [Streptomyces sp. NPDC059851]|uniref:transposase n=1 Tax=Streptomyces sp. NPDC059851 TaxID=3346971 RepID=UPI00364A7AF0